MHDWTLLSVLFEWKAGRVTLEFRVDELQNALIIADGVTDLHVPQLNEWGPSISVNEVRDIACKEPGKRLLSVEMQSGDVIEVTASSIQRKIAVGLR